MPFSPSSVAFHGAQRVGPLPQGIISGLNLTAHLLAVYASSVGLLRCNARLASERPGRPYPGEGWLPAGFQIEFQLFTSSLTRLILAHRLRFPTTFLLAGVNNRQIADLLGLSRQTVSKLLCVIYQKMGVENRIQSAV